MNRFRKPVAPLLAAVLALCAAIALAACGGDSGGDEDPNEVLEATFSADQEPVESGVFDVSIDLAAEGGDNDGSLTASLGGPFQSAGDDGVPSFDIDASLDLNSSVQDVSGEAGLTSTGDAAFVSFQDTNYEIPQEAFSQFAQTFTQLQAQANAEDAKNGQNLLSSIGVDPTNWLTDTSNEGDEDVEGEETIHISGTADVPKLVEDIKTIAENAPQAAEQVTPAQLGQLDQLTDIIESADFDIYSGKDDNVLRKFEASVDLNPPSTSGSPSDVTLDFSITLSDLNEPQEIAAPSDPQPLQGLLDSLGVDPSALGQLGALGAGSSGGGAGASAAPPAGGGAADAYLQCLQQAQGADALEQCEALLQ